ncbi:MAG TPA: hypothetical protein VES67_21325 [Vicinamibacterales bacterium]|nr:hypothetical protein [Vicinamibacterales bacterium]
MSLGAETGAERIYVESDLLLGISPSDPLAFAGTIAALAAVALAASYLPARRAARLNPVAALRAE